MELDDVVTQRVGANLLVVALQTTTIVLVDVTRTPAVGDHSWLNLTLCLSSLDCFLLHFLRGEVNIVLRHHGDGKEHCQN